MKSLKSIIFCIKQKRFLKKYIARQWIQWRWLLYNMFTNSENSKISETYRLLINLSDKVNLKRSDIYVAL